MSNFAIIGVGGSAAQRHMLSFYDTDFFLSTSQNPRKTGFL
jgi:hypothetical protein